MDANDKNTVAELDLSQKESVIANYPLFSLLTTKEVHELAKLMDQKNIEPEHIICTQGDILYKIYLIVSGTAMITRMHKTLATTQSLNLGTLSAGDCIGLSEAGFWARTGIHGATLTATTPMTLLVTELPKFLNFLSLPSRKYPGLKNAAERILLMNFISQTKLFSHLRHSQIHELAKKITKISVPPNTVLFEEGQDAENCYYILDGVVNATTINLSGKKHVLATLYHGMLFGEAAFLVCGKRNATIETVTKCELFELNRKTLLSNVQISSSMLNEVTKKRLRESRPLQNQASSVTKQITSDGKTLFILENSTNKINQIILTDKEYSLWQLMDGTNTLHQLTIKAQNELQLFTPDEFNLWVKKLISLGYLIFRSHSVKDHHENHSFLQSIRIKLERIFRLRD